MVGPSRLLPAVLTLAALLVLPACGAGGGASPVSGGTTIVVSSPGTLEAGPGQRVLLALADAEGAMAGGADVGLSARLEGPGGEALDADTAWVWAIPDVRGFYVAAADLRGPGTWRAWLVDASGREAAPASFQVLEDTPIPGPGDPAPRSETRTHPDHPLEQLTTDPDPDPELYDLSVAEAVTSGRPSLIVFATPAFCTSAVCGPTLDVVKEVGARHPEVETVHVEVYENVDTAGQEPLREVPAVAEWGLHTEPWVFVVDEEGSVTARFEGTVGAEELEQQLAALSG